MYNIQGSYIINEMFTNNKSSSEEPTDSPIVEAAAEAIDSVIGNIKTENHYCLSPNKKDGSETYKRGCKITVDGGFPNDENIHHVMGLHNDKTLKKRIISDDKCNRFSTWINAYTESDSDCKQLSDDIKEYKDHMKNGCKNKNDYDNMEDKEELIERLAKFGYWNLSRKKKFSELYYCLNNKVEKKLKYGEKGCKHDHQCDNNDWITICAKHDNGKSSCLSKTEFEIQKDVDGVMIKGTLSSSSSILCSLFLCCTLCYLLFFKKK